MGGSRWQAETGGVGGEDYARRFADLAASGVYIHGEADFVCSLVPPGSRLLDAGCGTGRVAIELAARGYSMVGTDVDASMLVQAIEIAPSLDWRQGDLASFALAPGEEPMDLAVLAGNVMIYLAEGTEPDVLARVSDAVRPGGLVVAGFSLGRLSLEDYDRHALDAGLALADRFSTWDSQPFEPSSDYAVSVHRKAGQTAR